MDVMYRGKMKTRADMIKEQLEITRQKKALQEANRYTVDLYPEDKRPVHMIESAYNRRNKENYIRNMNDFKENILNELVFQSMYSGIVEPVLEMSLMNNASKNLAAATIKDYILEEGADNILYKWKYKNFYLAEFAEIIDDTYKFLVEDAKNKIEQGLSDKDVYAIETDKIDNFIYDTKDIIPKDISNTIITRVRDAITDFSSDVKENKSKIMDIYNKAQDKISSLDGQQDISDDEAQAMQQEALRVAKRKELAITESTTNVFGEMVKILTESVMVIPVLQESYLNENGKVKMDKLLDNVKAIYTVMESFNTLGIIEEYEVPRILSGMEQSLKKEKEKIPVNDAERDLPTGYSPQPEEKHRHAETIGDNPLSAFSFNF